MPLNLLPTKWLRNAAWAVALTTPLSAATASAQSPPTQPAVGPTTGLPDALPAVILTPETPGATTLPASPDSATPPASPSTLPAAPTPPPPPPTGPRWQTPLPRPGYFAVPPTGPGYYSVLDALRGNELQAPPKYPYPRTSGIFQSNADINWSYLKNP